MGNGFVPVFKIGLIIALPIGIYSAVRQDTAGDYIAGAEIVDSVVMQDVTVGARSRIHRSILDKFVRVGEEASVGFGERSDDPALAWLDGLTLVGKDAAIPDGARIGPQVVVGVGAGADDFAAGALVPGTRIVDRMATQGLA